MRTIGAALVGVITACAAAAPARADWLEASSDHFIIRASTSESRLRDFATKLERFDAALRQIYGITDDPAIRANRVTILATSQPEVARLAGEPMAAGFYEARDGDSVIFTTNFAPAKKAEPQLGTRIASESSDGSLDPQSTLLHEYAHHFMYAHFPRAWPGWFSEGFAEFNANVRFGQDGSVLVGLPPAYRLMSLSFSAPMSMETLLDPHVGKPMDVNQFYGRSWLLVHFLMVESGRKGDLGRYLDALDAGQSSLDAARAAFGDLDVLRASLDRLYAKAKYSGLEAKGAVAPPIAITPLSPGMAAMMRVSMANKAAFGTGDDAAAKTKRVAAAQALAADAERTAAPYPNDAQAQSALADVELAAGRLDPADAAATRALAADPKAIDALLVKGRVAAARLSQASSRDAAQWKAARGWFIRANNLAPDAARPLLFYYRSYLAAGAQPSDAAYNGLLRAQQVAPESGDTRRLIAARLIETGKLDDARTMLRPLAYTPHGRKEESRAQSALKALDAGQADQARGALLAGMQDLAGS